MGYADKWTDEQLKKLENKITATYVQAAREMHAKEEKALAKYGKEREQRLKALDDTPEAKEEYENWLKAQVLKQERIQAAVSQLVDSAMRANERSVEMVRDDLPAIYVENANMAAYEIDDKIGYDTTFTLVDESTVRELMFNDDEQIIREVSVPKINRPKDYRWNRQKFTSAITQGILQGESIPNIVKRTDSIFGSNRAAAIRAARTATTSAENAGRINSYVRAKNMGIPIKQEWLATPDGRTRDTHRALDGERVEVGGVFSNGCKYPGDPDGQPSEVYNCRCTLTGYIDIDGLDELDSGERWTRLPDGVTYEDWKAGKYRTDKKNRETVESWQETRAQRLRYIVAAGIETYDPLGGIDGGFTLDYSTGGQYVLGESTGYAVGGFGTELIIPPEIYNDPAKLQKAIDDYIEANTEYLKEPGACLGGWVPSEGEHAGELYLDVSRVTRNRREAADWAIAKGEDSVTDFKAIDWPTTAQLASEYGKEAEYERASTWKAAKRSREYGNENLSDAMQEIEAGNVTSLTNHIVDGHLDDSREALHRKIIDDLLWGKDPAKGQPTLMMLGGGPASGKSSVLAVDADDPDMLTVNPDELKDILPGYSEMSRETDAAGTYYHEESSALGKRLSSVAYKEQYNVLYDSAGDGSTNSMRKKIKEARDEGYRVEARYVTVNTEDALERNLSRYKKAKERGENPRLVPDDVLIGTHAKVTDISIELAPEFDYIELWDNNGDYGETKLIARGGGGRYLTIEPGEEEAMLAYLAKSENGVDGFAIMPDGQVKPKEKLEY